VRTGLLAGDSPNARVAEVCCVLAGADIIIQ
jgi:hypothetical protein